MSSRAVSLDFSHPCRLRVTDDAVSHLASLAPHAFFVHFNVFAIIPARNMKHACNGMH